MLCSSPGGWLNSESCRALWNETGQFRSVLLFRSTGNPGGSGAVLPCPLTASVAHAVALMEVAGSKAKLFYFHFFLMAEIRKEVVKPELNIRDRMGREECSNCCKAAQGLPDPRSLSLLFSQA